MKYFNIKNWTLLLATALFLSSCIKDDVSNRLNNEGTTLFKIMESPTSSVYLQPFSNVQAIPLFNIRKDAPNAAELNTTTVVKLQSDTSLIGAYDRANGDTYEPLPDSLYTLNSDITSAGGFYTATFAPGEFAKDFTIKLNGAKWNLSHKYAIGVHLNDVGGKKISADKNTVLVLISIKNQWAGTYKSNGYLYHPSSPRAISGILKNVVTAGPTSVTVDLGDLGGSGYKALLTIDPATNNVNVVAAPGASGGTYYMFSAGLPSSNPGYTAQWSGSASCNNTYDPNTHTFYLRYGYLGGTGYRVTEEILNLQ